MKRMLEPFRMRNPVTQPEYLDLRGLSAYSALGVGTLRDYIRDGSLPCFKVKGKILIRRSEFDKWLEGFRVKKSQDLKQLVDEVMQSLKA